MKGYRILLIAALALAALGVPVLLAGCGVLADEPAGPDALQKSGALATLSGAPASKSEECPKAESTASDPSLETQFSGSVSGNLSLETEASGPDAADALRDLGLPEGLSLSITGMGETCK